MHKDKPISMLLSGHFQLSMKKSPTSEKEKAEIENVPYSFVVSLVCAMIYTRPDITYAIGSISQLLTNARKEH